MNLPLEHELLSAYLDGELTAGERARVEQLLADSPAARRVLDELRSVSVTVQGLPELRLAEDLTDRILRQAERAILSGQDATPRVEPASPPDSGRYRRLFLRMVTSRGVAWSGAALAIALLIMLSGPREHQRDFARAPEGAAREATPAAPAKSAPEAKPPMSGEMWSADSRRDGFSSREAADLDMAMPHDEPESSKLTLDDAPKSAAGPMLKSAAGPMPAAAPMLDLHAQSAPEQPAASEPQHVRPGVAPPAPMDEREEAPAAEQRFRRAQTRVPERMEERGEKKADAAVSILADAKQRKGAEPAELPVLLVHCDVTPETARKRTLDQMLVDQQVVAQDNRRKAGDADRLLGLDAGSRRANGRDGRESAETDDFDADSREPFDVVYVEATHEQVAATLDQMARLPDQFLAVSIKPAPGIPSQSNLTRFNRRVATGALAAPGGAVAPEPKPTSGFAGEVEPARKPKEQVDKMESNQQAAPMPRPMLGRSAGGQPGRQGPHMAGAGGAGYGAASAIKEEGRPEAASPRQSASSELAQPDTLQYMAKAKDAPPTDSPPVQYRVLFVLRVVPPAMLAAPTADTAAESLPTDAAASPAAAAVAPAEPAVPAGPPAEAAMESAPAAASPGEMAEPAPE